MNLKESRERYMESLEGGHRREKCYNYIVNLKSENKKIGVLYQ